MPTFARICVLALTTQLATCVVAGAQAPVARAQAPVNDAADQQQVRKHIADLSDRNLLTRWNAAFRLGQIGSAASPATPALITALRDRDFRVIWYSIHALGHIGPDAEVAVPALREALSANRDTENPKYVAAMALGDKYTRRFAAQAIGRIGAGAKEAMPDLRRAMQSKDASLRVAAALALWQVAEDRAAIDVISKMLAADDVNAAHEAALAMTHLGSAGRPAVGDLIRALESGTEDVRRSAARALGQLGPVATAALTEALGSSSVSVRRAAAQGFGWLGQAVTEKVLHNDRVKMSVFQSVYDRLNASAVAALRIALADKDSDVRRLSAEALGTIGPVAVPTLIEAMKEPNADLRRAAALALERIETRSPLGEVLPERADHFRKASASSLVAAIGSHDPLVRRYAVRMFASLGVGSVAPEARPQLVRLLKDDNVQVRRYAFTSLRQIRESQNQQPKNQPTTMPAEDQ